jgi:nucleoside-diphosphate-sugar epimerase
VAGVRRLLRAASRTPTLRRLLHVSTTDVYGYRRHAGDETTPIRDVGLPYNRSKGLGELAVWACHRQTGLPVTVVRPASIYGPRSKDFVLEIARAVQRRQMVLVGDGRVPAGLIYIDNAVDAILAAAEAEDSVGQAYALRDETPTTGPSRSRERRSGRPCPRRGTRTPGRPRRRGSRGRPPGPARRGGPAGSSGGPGCGRGRRAPRAAA